MFWRVFASFWLAIALVAGLSLLLGHAANQDTWIIARHPAIANFAGNWVKAFEAGDTQRAYSLLERRKSRYHMDVQILDVNYIPLMRVTQLPAPPLFGPRNDRRLPWRRLTEEYTSEKGNTYLFIYRLPYPELDDWRRSSLLWPLSALGIALVVLTLFSLLLTLSITRPLDRLRRAVHDLGHTVYQQESLSRLARRHDELGVLARDFNRMGQRLQGLIGSQRQLLRDVSHELRSPLARLRIALALAERAGAEERERLWPRLTQECDRLEALISEILALARLDAEPGASHRIELLPLARKLREDAKLSHPNQRIDLHIEPDLTLLGWPDMLERALDNLLRNALRFNPPSAPIEIVARRRGERLLLSVRDQGPGVAEEHLERLGEPFFREPGQSASGHGLGLAIARRAVERHAGNLILGNHPQGGFIATLDLPLDRGAT
nr:HAMP domain-containing sensor histidine kinase [Pseudomonas sp. RIT-PI-AD]